MRIKVIKWWLTGDKPKSPRTAEVVGMYETAALLQGIGANPKLAKLVIVDGKEVEWV